MLSYTKPVYNLTPQKRIGIISRAGTNIIPYVWETFLPGNSVLLTSVNKYPESGIVEEVNYRQLWYTNQTTLITMKLIIESVKNFGEGFVSFYKSCYNAMLKW